VKFHVAEGRIVWAVPDDETKYIFQFGSQGSQHNKAYQEKQDLHKSGSISIKNMLIEDDNHQWKSDIECGEYLNQQHLQKGFFPLKEIMAQSQNHPNQENQVQVPQRPGNI
jgi:hypothetical protein